MGNSTQVAQREEAASRVRKAGRARRTATQLRWPTPKNRRVGAPMRRAVERRNVVAGRPAPTASRSMFAKVQDWMQNHPGHENTPSEQALDAIAHTAYFRNR